MLEEKAAKPVQSSRGLLDALPYVLNLVLPIAAYFILTALGLSDFWALTIGGLLTGVNAVVNTVRRGKLDSLGLLVLVEVALSVALIFGTQDPRLVLARPSLYIAVGGVWVLAKAFSRRPVTIDASKPMATKGNPQRTAAFEWCAANDDTFRRAHRDLSVLWGVVFLVYSIARLVVIYSVNNLSESVWLTEVPGIIGIVICLLAAKNAGEKLKKTIDAQLERMFPPAAPPSAG